MILKSLRNLPIKAKIDENSGGLAVSCAISYFSNTIRIAPQLMNTPFFTHLCDRIYSRWLTPIKAWLKARVAPLLPQVKAPSARLSKNDVVMAGEKERQEGGM